MASFVYTVPSETLPRARLVHLHEESWFRSQVKFTIDELRVLMDRQLNIRNM